MSNEEIIKQIDLAINELVYDKVGIRKTYNYYNGQLDEEQFRHLEENYGIGTPTQLTFIPLIRKHIDVLVSDYTSISMKPQITCKDEKTLSSIMRDQQLSIYKSVFDHYKSQLNNQIMSVFSQDGKAEPDPFIENKIETLKRDMSNSYVSDYELAAHNIIANVAQSRRIDFETKKSILVKDLLITGTCYYKVKKINGEKDLDIEIYNPYHTFIEKNPNSIYLKNSYRSVARKYMSRMEVLNAYGTHMNKDLIKQVKEAEPVTDNVTQVYYTSSTTNGTEPARPGIISGLEVTPGLPNETSFQLRNYKMFVVYEVEWLDVEEEGDDYKMYRYEGIRINNNIYIPIGKVEVSRNAADPNKCTLALNGLFFSDRNGAPFSLVMATADLQDKYNIAHFYRDLVMAASGVKGDWVDVSVLPAFLGDNVTERLQKFMAYKKSMGVALIDTSQEGRVFNNNTTFSGYDDSMQAQLMQAFDYVIQSLENTCASITGVSKERLANGIEQRDAVTNVQMGVKMSSIITKQYFTAMDNIVKEILNDVLNTAKVVYKKGFTGTLIMGDKLQRIFTAMPEHFTTTDFDVHINDSSETVKDVDTIKQLTMEFVKAGAVDMEMAVDVMDTKSMTEVKQTIKKGIQVKKEENGQMQQMQQQLQQAQQQLQQLQKALQDEQSKNQKSQSDSSQITANAEEKKLQLEWFKAKNLKEFQTKEVEHKDKLLEAETMQLYDSNPRNNEIKNV